MGDFEFDKDQGGVESIPVAADFDAALEPHSKQQTTVSVTADQTNGYTFSTSIKNLGQALGLLRVTATLTAFDLDGETAGIGAGLLSAQVTWYVSDGVTSEPWATTNPFNYSAVGSDFVFTVVGDKTSASGISDLLVGPNLALVMDSAVYSGANHPSATVTCDFLFV